MLNCDFQKFIDENIEDLKAVLKQLAVIPAPSHHEENRAEFVENWLTGIGAKGVYIDDAKNVVYPVNVTEDNNLAVIMAHTDIVFDYDTPLNFVEKDGKYYCPGIGDDTQRLVTLLFAVKYFLNKTPNMGILFVANSCEEGLGNIKGCRKIIDTFGNRVKEFITFDASHGVIINRAVGSHRYKIEVNAQGGHSLVNFGRPNAIAQMSDIINTLYKVEVPQREDSITTYNVGHIEGGTTVNTIPQHCEALYEYRSNDIACLASMKQVFENIIEDYKNKGCDVSVELLGERPCMAQINEDKMEALIAKIQKGYDAVNVNSIRKAASTDANYPLSKGIPAVCAGLGVSKGAHTTEEYVEIASLADGLLCALTIINEYYK